MMRLTRLWLIDMVSVSLEPSLVLLFLMLSLPARSTRCSRPDGCKEESELCNNHNHNVSNDASNMVYVPSRLQKAPSFISHTCAGLLIVSILDHGEGEDCVGTR